MYLSHEHRGMTHEGHVFLFLPPRHRYTYNAYAIPNTTSSSDAVASCQQACATDGTLCFGFFLKAAPSPDAEIEKPSSAGAMLCSMLSGWDESYVRRGDNVHCE